MAFDYEIASKGIINAINNMATAKTQAIQRENELMATVIKAQREKEMKEWEKGLMSPLEKQKFDNQNNLKNQYMGQGGQTQFPAMAMGGAPMGQPQESPDLNAMMSLTGGGMGNIQGQQLPEIDSFSGASEQKIEMTPDGSFKASTLTPKQGIWKRIQEKESRGYPLSKTEVAWKNKYLGIDEANDLNAALQDVQVGKKSYADVRKEFPAKAEEIRKAQIGSLSPRSQNIVNQIEGAIKISARRLAEGKAAASPDEIAIEALKDLVERRDEAKAKGIDVDAILDAIGFTEEEILFGKKNPGVMQRVQSFITGIFQRPSAEESEE